MKVVSLAVEMEYQMVVKMVAGLVGLREMMRVEKLVGWKAGMMVDSKVVMMVKTLVALMVTNSVTLKVELSEFP